MELYLVYILTNDRHSIFYTGRTKNLKTRVYLHKGKWKQAFTKKYNVTKLVYFEAHDTIEEASLIEKKIKKLSQKNKSKLIEKMNPTWKEFSFSYEGTPR